MTGTRAIPLDLLTAVSYGVDQRPLCPACHGGRLHPYIVNITLSHGPNPVHGADYLTGWVAVCVGSQDDPMLDEQVEPCGFSMPMTPRRAGQ